MTYLAVMAFLQRASKVSVGFIRDNWKWLSFFVFVVAVWLYVQSIKSDRDDYQSRYLQSVEAHQKYVEEQNQAYLAKEKQVGDLIEQMGEFSKGVEREIKDRNEVIDRITDSNSALVDRLRQQTTEAINSYKQLPNADPTIIYKFESTGKSLVECSGRYSEVAGVADQNAITVQGLGQIINEFNRNVEELNKGELPLPLGEGIPSKENK